MINRVRAPALAALLIFMPATVAGRPLFAQTLPVVLPASSSPIVRVVMRSGNLTIRTWNRNDVQIASADPFSARSFRPEAVARALSNTIPIFATTVATPNGPLTLPLEEFTLSPLPSGPHDGVLVQAQIANIMLTVPANTALILTNVQRGRVFLQGYHNAMFVIRVHNGGLRLHDVSGAGYAEVARGPIVVSASSFGHLRARTAVGNIIFADCAASQIEVSSINGTIIYDNGSFEPGLARFESENGNVALGIARSDVQIGAHSSVGRIYSSLDAPAIRPGQTDAQIGSGSTAVTASSGHGAVFLYSGALRSQKRLGAAWAPLARFAQRRAPPRRPFSQTHPLTSPRPRTVHRGRR